MKRRFIVFFLGFYAFGASAFAQHYPYQDPANSPDVRAKDLLGRMSVEEKVNQLQSQMVFTDFAKRDYRLGHTRNKGHFLHAYLKRKGTPTECADALNEDTRRSMEASRWKIPVLQNGEALHGAQWGYATSFPQSIAMAASFDPDLYYQVGLAVAKELRAVGVRQVFAPVINICRDPRWGRNEETYGEDVLLNARMGVAYVKALETSGVIATPKHFVDNYGDGGHDSYASNNSWRTLREVYLEPFRACVEEGKARSIMVSYNAVDGVPCTSNDVLINDILRKEWKFGGFVVSDYGGVGGVASAHHVAADYKAAQAASLAAGMDVELPNGYPDLLELVRAGRVQEAQLDSSVYRVLKCKFELGLFEQPTVDSRVANTVVRCPEHQDLALQAARKCVTLLRNENEVLPLSKQTVKRVGVCGPIADFASSGGYSGPFRADKFDFPTPYQALKHYLKGHAEVLLYDEKEDLQSFVKRCDVVLYFAGINEGEGGDRSKLTLPKSSLKSVESLKNAIIVEGGKKASIDIDQEQQILDIARTDVKSVVVLQNGGYIDMSRWVNQVDGIVEAWYLGERGGQAIAETLFGENNPSGHLPFSWARHSGQVPIYYSIKPSGRGYAYNDDDGKPLYPFGYGLSYTTFEFSDFIVPATLPKGRDLEVKVSVKNTGKRKGEAVPQLYLKDGVTSVVHPILQMKAFQRVALEPGESKVVTLKVPYQSFGLWNRRMQYTVEQRKASILIATDAQTVHHTSEIEIQ